MELVIKELEEKVNILANQWVIFKKNLVKYVEMAENDKLEFKKRDEKIDIQLSRLSNLINKLDDYHSSYKQTRILNRVFIGVIVMLIGCLGWGYFEINGLREDNENMRADIKGITNVLLGKRQFWVADDDRVKWDWIEDIPKPRKK